MRRAHHGTGLCVAGFTVALLTTVIAGRSLAQQDVSRVHRSETHAAELLGASAGTRESLVTPVFDELRATLPKARLDGVLYYFVEGDCRLTEDELIIHAARLERQYAVWSQLKELSTDVRIAITDLEQQLVSEVEAGRVVRWTPNSTLSYCVLRRSFGSGPTAAERYRTVASEFSEALLAWTGIPNTSVPDFEYRNDLDASSAVQRIPKGVTFAVSAADLPGSVIASAFFPNDPQDNWRIYIDLDEYFSRGLPFDRVGVLRHEIGHVLGFRHEHPRSEAPLLCQTLEVFEGDEIPHGEYDPISVMHYFCRGFNNPEQEELNRQRRKLRLTALDVRGARLVYPPAGESSGLQFLDIQPTRLASANMADGASGNRVASHRSSNVTSPNVSSSNVDDPSPWVEPQDATTAIHDPDRYAWQLFIALNWPADAPNRRADRSRSFGENATTVWESWKLSSGTRNEVFLADGSDPGPWLAAEVSGERNRLTADFERRPLQQLEGIGADFHDAFDPETSSQGLNENHMNAAAYEFIRDRELFNVEGQEQLLAEARKAFERARGEQRPAFSHEYKLHFPQGAKEVKAQWRPISEADKPRYRWAEFTDPAGRTAFFGLTALHITTKDLPNWFWATFEHVDNPRRRDAEQWELPSIDSAAGPSGYPENMGIGGTRWQNYRLRGTQVDFVDSSGNGTILANSQIESGFQLTSSCITCHAKAAIGGPRPGMTRANRLPIFKARFPQPEGRTIFEGDVGALPIELFVSRSLDDPITGDLEYLQLDFVWSFLRARRKSAAPVPAEVSFNSHLRPLFRPVDIQSMQGYFDLRDYDDVKEHAATIYSRLADGTMPCDTPWSQQQIALFKSWMDTGMKE